MKSITINTVTRRIFVNMLSMWAGVADSRHMLYRDGKVYQLYSWDEGRRTWVFAVNARTGRLELAWVEYDA